MIGGEKDMKLLKIEDNLGYFLDENDGFTSINKITKEGLLRLVDQTIAEDAEFDEYDQEAIKNAAHQIIYKSIYQKLRELSDKKKEFIDEVKREYLAEYEKYREDPLQNGSS